MSGYLDRLVRRARGEAPGLRPRQMSSYEPIALLEQAVEVPGSTPAAQEEATERRVPGAGPVAQPATAWRPSIAEPGGRRSAEPELPGPSNPDAIREGVTGVGSPPRPSRGRSTATDGARVPSARAPATQNTRQPTDAHPDGRPTARRAVAAPTVRPSIRAGGRAWTDVVPPAVRTRDPAPARGPVGPGRARSDLPPAARPAPTPRSDTVIEVTIGRVEVAATSAPAPRTGSRPSVRRPPVELSDYLKQRRSAR